MTSDDEKIANIEKEIAKKKADALDVCFLLENPHFRRRPVPPAYFITQEPYLNCPEAWPEIQKIMSEFMSPKDWGNRFSDYTEGVFDGGIGSGKSFFVSFVFCYVVYWLSCLKDPQAFYGLAPKSTICLVNCSTTANQAKRVVFGKIQARVDSSPYFQEYFKPDKNIRSELRFPRDIVIFPGSSSETAPIGYDVLVANVDEASFFVSTDARDSAAEVFDTLDRRIRSRFEDRGLMLTTSSPRYVDDFTEKKYAESLEDPKIYGVKRPVWETKPRDIEQLEAGEFFEASPPGSTKVYKIPLAYEKAFKKNSKKAWRDYGAVASLALEPFFTDEELERLHKIMCNSKISCKGFPNPDIRPLDKKTYRAHVDLGLKRDACGVCVGHVDGQKVVIDYVLRIVCAVRAREFDDTGQHYDMILGQDQVDIGGLYPQPHGVLGIFYRMAAEGFLFSQISFDGFQSAHSMQQLNDNGFITALVSVDKTTAAYDTFKSVMNMQHFDCPNHPHIMNEAKRLELIDGRKVDHPKNASKDLTDAIAGVCFALAQEQGEEQEDSEIVADESFRINIQPEI